MKVIKSEGSWHASSDAFPGCRGQAPLRSDAIEQLMLAIEEQFNDGMRQTIRRLMRNIIIQRNWSADCEYVDSRMRDKGIDPNGLPGIIDAWQEQVEHEFNEALPGGQADGSGSVITLFASPCTLEYDSGSYMATFEAALDFWYDDYDAGGFTEDRDIISHIFYAEGGVAGNYKLLSWTEEETAREEGGEE